jgi:transcriptional regulator with XRE-family HTH domain
MSENESLSQLEQQAMFLADADSDMRARLVELRKKSGLNQTEVGRRMGISQESVAAFERYDNDPKLSTLRRYALAVGARIGHSVEMFDGQHISHEETVTATVVFKTASVAMSKASAVVTQPERQLVLTVSS